MFNVRLAFFIRQSCDFKFFGRLPQIPLPQFVMMHKDFFIRNIPQGSLCTALGLLIISKKKFGGTDHAYGRRTFISCCRRYDVRSLCCCGGRFARAAAQGGACRTGDGKKEASDNGGHVRARLCRADDQLYHPRHRLVRASVRRYAAVRHAGAVGRLFVHDRHSCHSGAVLC